MVGAVLQPVPLCSGAMNCPRVAKRLAKVLDILAHDSRCAAHACVAPARAARLYPPSWLRSAAPSDSLLALSNQQLCKLWGDMVRFQYLYTFYIVRIQRLYKNILMKYYFTTFLKHVY